MKNKAEIIQNIELIILSPNRHREYNASDKAQRIYDYMQDAMQPAVKKSGCLACNGTGRVTYGQGFSIHCLNCNGTGQTVL